MRKVNRLFSITAVMIFIIVLATYTTSSFTVSAAETDFLAVVQQTPVQALDGTIVFNEVTENNFDVQAVTMMNDVMMVPVAVSSYSATTMIGTMVISDAYLDELQFKTQSNGLGEDSATSVSGIDVADGIHTAAALTSSTMNFVGIDVVAMFYEATSASVVVTSSITDNAAGFALTGYV